MKPDKSIVALLRPVIKKFGPLECVPCANKLKRKLQKRGYEAVILKLSTVPGGPANAYIVLKEGAKGVLWTDDAISEKGKHFGVEVEGFVFDNLHPNGTLRKRWKRQFDCASHRFKIKPVEKAV
jgi:hypothetical protein